MSEVETETVTRLSEMLEKLRGLREVASSAVTQYETRVQTLEDENKRLREEVAELKKALSAAECKND